MQKYEHSKTVKNKNEQQKVVSLLAEVDNKEVQVDFCATCVLKSTLPISTCVFWIQGQ